MRRFDVTRQTEGSNKGSHPLLRSSTLGTHTPTHLVMSIQVFRFYFKPLICKIKKGRISTVIQV